MSPPSTNLNIPQDAREIRLHVEERPAPVDARDAPVNPASRLPLVSFAFSALVYRKVLTNRTRVECTTIKGFFGVVCCRFPRSGAPHL